MSYANFLQESVFGEDQVFTDMNDPSNLSNNDSQSASTTTAPVDSSSVVSEDEVSKKEFDPRLYRPLDVVVSITMHDIQAHLMKVDIIIFFSLSPVKFACHLSFISLRAAWRRIHRARSFCSKGLASK